MTEFALVFNAWFDLSNVFVTSFTSEYSDVAFVHHYCPKHAISFSVYYCMVSFREQYNIFLTPMLALIYYNFSGEFSHSLCTAQSPRYGALCAQRYSALNKMIKTPLCMQDARYSASCASSRHTTMIVTETRAPKSKRRHTSSLSEMVLIFSSFVPRASHVQLASSFVTVRRMDLLRCATRPLVPVSKATVGAELAKQTDEKLADECISAI